MKGGGYYHQQNYNGGYYNPSTSPLVTPSPMVAMVGGGGHNMERMGFPINNNNNNNNNMNNANAYHHHHQQQQQQINIQQQQHQQINIQQQQHFGGLSPNMNHNHIQQQQQQQQQQQLNNKLNYLRHHQRNSSFDEFSLNTESLGIAFKELTWEEIYLCYHHFQQMDDGYGVLKSFSQLVKYISSLYQPDTPPRTQFLLAIGLLYPNAIPQQQSPNMLLSLTLKQLIEAYSCTKSIVYNGNNRNTTPPILNQINLTGQYQYLNIRKFTPQQACYIIDVFNSVKDKTGGVPTIKLSLFGADPSMLPSTTLPFHEFVQYIGLGIIPFEHLFKFPQQSSPPIEGQQIFVTDLDDLDNNNNNNNLNINIANNPNPNPNPNPINNPNNPNNNNNNNNNNRQVYFDIDDNFNNNYLNHINMNNYLNINNNQNNNNNNNNNQNNSPLNPSKHNHNYNQNNNQNNNNNNINNQNNNNNNLQPPPQQQLKTSGGVTKQESYHSDIEISFSELNITSKLGEGTFGVVYKGTWRGSSVAIKQLKINEHVNNQVLEEFRKELTILSRLRHPNIVLLMAACTSPPNLCFVTEFLPGGSLYDALHSKKIKMNMQLYKKLAIQIAQGMNYLHLSGIIHRDIKSLNLLLDEHMNVKICDFGLSKLKSKSTEMTKSIGSPIWMSPELLMGEDYTEKVDVYAFGIILWELGTGELPYAGLDSVQLALAVTTKSLRPPIPNVWPPTLVNLIQSCWHQDPHMRPNFSEILNQLEKI